MNRLGPIDILVNDAAYNKPIPFNDLEKLNYEDWTKILSVNLDGPFLCSKAVAPIMKEIGSGRIINTVHTSVFCIPEAAISVKILSGDALREKVPQKKSLWKCKLLHRK